VFVCVVLLLPRLMMGRRAWANPTK
jgi:hypothetical protein